jgi:Spy/CpxP family protein refolding chaperone
MKRSLLIFLAFSLGLNVGLVWYFTADRLGSRERHSPPPPVRITAPDEQAATPTDAEAAIEAHLDVLSRDLGLDGGQVAALRALLTKRMPQMAHLLRRTTEANRRISDAYGTTALDSTLFRDLVAAASAARTRADSLSSVILLEEARILTPQQRERFAHVAPVMYSTARRDPPPTEPGPPPPRPEGTPPPKQR